MHRHQPTIMADPAACTRCGRTIREESVMAWLAVLLVAVATLVTAASVAILRHRGDRRRG